MRGLLLLDASRITDKHCTLVLSTCCSRRMQLKIETPCTVKNAVDLPLFLSVCLSVSLSPSLSLSLSLSLFSVAFARTSHIHHLLVCVFKTGTCQKTWYHVVNIRRDSFGHFSFLCTEDISLSILRLSLGKEGGNNDTQ